MYIPKKYFQKIFILAIFFSSSASFASNVATEDISGVSISLSPSVEYDIATLRVTNDKTDSETIKEYPSGDFISLDLSGMDDGMYHYELALTTNIEKKNESDDQEVSYDRQSGQFIILNGTASIHNDAIASAEVESTN